MNRPVSAVDPAEVEHFRQALQAVYGEVDAEVATLAPVCRISGRCCRFEEYGHTLFVSAPEFALLLADAPEPSRPLDDGKTCPWQDQKGRCTAREARPIGCRVYFCDPNYESAAPEIAERGISRLKRMVDERALPWDYATLHDHLQQARDDGRYSSNGPVGSAD